MGPGLGPPPHMWWGYRETEGMLTTPTGEGTLSAGALDSGTLSQALPMPHPTPSRYLVKILALRSQLGHDGLHAATPGT